MGIPRGYLSTRAARQKAADAYIKKETEKRLGIPKKKAKRGLKKFLPKTNYVRVGGKVQKSFQYSELEKTQALEKRKKANRVNYSQRAQQSRSVISAKLETTALEDEVRLMEERL